MLPSIETVEVAISNPGLEAYDMFSLALLAKKIPRMEIVDSEGLILFPSAVYFPLSLATIANMRAELLRTNLLQLGVTQQVVTDLRLVASLRESLKWHAIYKAWCNLSIGKRGAAAAAAGDASSGASAGADCARG